MKIKIIIIFFLLFFIKQLYSDTLGDLIINGDWEKFESIFKDKSYVKLKNKFVNYSKVYFKKVKQGRIKYYIKFDKSAEIGFIDFKKKKGIYRGLKINTIFQNMKFINEFEKYTVNKKVLKIGDAKIVFKNGFLYRAKPFDRLLFFRGNYNLKIDPNDNEERKTLKYLYKADTYTLAKKKCMLILNEESISKLLDGIGSFQKKIVSSNTIFIEEELAFLKKEYGINIDNLKESWYPPFIETLNIMIFRKNDSFYKFVFNRNNIPDTYLFNVKTRKHILNYNKITGMRLFIADSNKIKKIQLNIRINPYKFKIWSTALLLFPNASDYKTFEIFRDMKVNDFYKEDNRKLNYLRYGDKFNIIGLDFKEVSFYYSGKLNDNRKQLELLKHKSKENYGKIDNFIFFDNENKFYPNPGNQFFESTLNISVPSGFNCLASGFFKEKEFRNSRMVKLFKSEGTKGLTVVCGKFKILDDIESKIPLSIFGYQNVDVKKYINRKEVKKIIAFLLEKYGKRGIERINVLLRRWFNYGGISYKGFIVFNVVEKNIKNIKKSMAAYYISNPVFLTKKLSRDNFVHELAHQWWGGIVSWKTFKDVWMTEGGAQFSALIYLESVLSKKKFKRIIKKVIKKVRKNSQAGPLVYGKRIGNITEDRNIYQSLIYNKSALVFLMYRELVGEKKLFKRINSVFSKFYNKSISTRIFIDEMISSENKIEKKYLKRFFNSWIFNRDIPRVHYCIKINKKTARIVFEQINTDFVFPLEIIIKTINGKESKKVIIKDKMQEFIIVEKHDIKKIKVEKSFSPVYLKEVKNGR